jgi:hypothetical protein
MNNQTNTPPALPILDWKPTGEPTMPAVALGRWRTDGSAALATVQLITEAAVSIPDELKQHYFDQRIIAAAHAFVAEIDGVKRYLNLCEQRDEAERRKAIAGATVAKLQAERNLVETTAAPGFASKLLKIDKQIAEEQAAAEQAAEEYHVIRVSVNAARSRITSCCGDFAMKLLPEITAKLQEARDAAWKKAEEALQKVVAETLSPVLMLDALLERAKSELGYDSLSGYFMGALDNRIEAVASEPETAEEPAKEESPALATV